MQHKDKGRDNTLLKELPAEADNFQWGGVVCLSSEARPEIESELAVLEIHKPLHCVFLGKKYSR